MESRHRWDAYFGWKATSGFYQPIIALMPPHDTYIETHLGGGAIMQRKPAALRNIGIDRNQRALERFRCPYAVQLVHGCAHMSKIKQKVSGCFRKPQYAEAYCRISSYLQTMANRGYNPLLAIQLALSGQLYAESGKYLQQRYIGLGMILRQSAESVSMSYPHTGAFFTGVESHVVRNSRR
jgi:hypothetical protein